jgi:hypothetical protein
MSLDEVCSEMKRRCYERGAEDNLTAVIVRIGGNQSPTTGNDDFDRTIDPLTTPALARTLPGNTNAASTEATVETAPVKTSFQPASRIAFPATDAERDVIAHASASSDNASGVATEVKSSAAVKPGPSTGGRLARALVLLLLGVVAGAAAAHYGKALYEKRLASLSQPEVAASPSPTPVVVEDPVVIAEKRRREVDSAPAAWLASGMQTELAKQNIQKPLDSPDPDFLYLYGRALLLTGDFDGALGAFEQAITKLEERTPGARTPQKVDVRLARAAAALRSGRYPAMQPAINSLNEVIEKKEGATATPGPQ